MRRSVSCVAAGLVVAVLAPRPGLAGLSKDQQSCVNDMNKFADPLPNSRAGPALDAPKTPGPAYSSGVETPPQAQTAQACLTNDVGGKVAKDTTKLQERDASKCLEAPEQPPAFGYTGTAATDTAARAAAL